MSVKMKASFLILNRLQNPFFSISARQRDQKARALIARPRLYVTDRLAFSQFGLLTYLLSVTYLQALKTPRKVKALVQSLGAGVSPVHRLFSDSWRQN